MSTPAAGEALDRREPAPAPTGTAPQLDFQIAGAGVMEYAAVPTLAFQLAIASGGAVIRSLVLHTQVRIAASRRTYDERERARLREIFGDSSQWASSAKSLLWTQSTVQIPGFTGSTLAELAVPCTYDFEIAVAKYFHGVEDGEIPLDFLFSGTLFYAGEGGLLQAARIAWDREAGYRLPVRVWKEMMEHYFPGTAWLRLRRDVFDRLYAFKAGRALPTWEDALEALLPAAGAEG